MISLLPQDREGSWDQSDIVRSIGRLAKGLLILILFMYAWWWTERFITLTRYIQAVFVLLLLMAVGSIGVMIERCLRYRVAHHQSRGFVQQVAEALRDRNLDEAIAIAGHYKRSPIAKVVAAGLASFQAAMPFLSDAEVIGTAKRALRRLATVVRGEMKRGLNILASVSSTAPLVGAFGTMFGIMDSFKGCGADKATCMAATFQGLSEGLLPTALGLLVALPALLCHKYLRSELEASDLEMENESLKLVNYLTVYLERRK